MKKGELHDGGRTVTMVDPDRADSERSYSEMYGEDGQPRAHWRPMQRYLQRLGPAQLLKQQAFIRTQVRDNGVTYNMYSSGMGARRPWELDPLPWLLEAGEWAALSQAVAQRARLLDRVLADLYGPQTLLQQGLLPPALVFGHPDFVWPCQGLQPVGGRFLHFYAVDLTRAADGRWRVLSDRTQAPSGAGYALENRLIVARTQAELLGQYRVHPLADFFRGLRQQLSAQAPSDGETPLLVLLTPGPYNETYFEHAYLARYLGFPLVEGQDLTVRAETVYLKTLTGLQRVHGIVRRIDDSYCDPLELRGDSALGVPGLLQAVRAGRVLLANAPGTGVVESAAFKPFLPAISQHLLGEPLQLESVPGWWCGEPAALEHVLKHLDRMVIRPAYPSDSHGPESPADLSANARMLLIDSLCRQPHAYVAEERCPLSTLTVVNVGGGLEQRAISLRLYAAAAADGQYLVMPGGLARIAGQGQTQYVSMQQGGGSKDVWITGDPGKSQATGTPRSMAATELQRSPSNLSSRIVENLFWFGRYTTRCNDIARLLRVALARFDDASDQAPWAQAAAIDICAALSLVPERSLRADAQGMDRLLWSAVRDAEQAESLVSNLKRLGWTAMQIRERLSLDNWMVLQQMQESPAGDSSDDMDMRQALDFLDRSLVFCAGLTGFAMDGMTRDHGWRLLMIGRHLERLGFLATVIARFLRLGAGSGWGGMDWMLEVADSMVTYRSRYRSHAELLPLVDLIVFDDSNPCSVLFQLQQLREHLGCLATALGQTDDPMCQELDRQASALSWFQLDRLSRMSDQACLELAEMLEQATLAAWRLSDQLAMRHFTHVTDASHQTLAA
ncbi:circularly permuted type 2 ATP-grasp protein [Frateuria aurantia]